MTNGPEKKQKYRWLRFISCGTMIFIVLALLAVAVLPFFLYRMRDNIKRPVNRFLYAIQDSDFGEAWEITGGKGWESKAHLTQEAQDVYSAHGRLKTWRIDRYRVSGDDVPNDAIEVYLNLGFEKGQKKGLMILVAEKRKYFVTDFTITPEEEPSTPSTKDD